MNRDHFFDLRNQLINKTVFLTTEMGRTEYFSKFSNGTLLKNSSVNYSGLQGVALLPTLGF